MDRKLNLKSCLLNAEVENSSESDKEIKAASKSFHKNSKLR